MDKSLMSALTKQKDYKTNCHMLNDIKVKQEVRLSLKKEACERKEPF